MRHEKNFRQSDKLRVVPVPAVWPQLLAGEPESGRDAPAALPAPAVPDVPSAVGKLLVGTYAMLVGVLFALMARSPLALFSIVIAAGFVAIYFAVPWLFLRVEADPSRRPSFDRFIDRGIDTATGRTTGKDALVQMLTVPVLLILGLAAMGVIGFIYI
jgi:hypothetical protein